MKVFLTATALKSLVRHPQREKLRAKIEQLASDPGALANNVTRLKGQVESRLRVGDVRVIFHIDGDMLVVDDIGPRGGIYD